MQMAVKTAKLSKRCIPGRRRSWRDQGHGRLRFQSSARSRLTAVAPPGS
jgi:hypothetical protein